MRNIIGILLLLVIAASAAGAHNGTHEKAAKPDSTAVKDSLRSESGLAESGHKHEAEEPHGDEEEFNIPRHALQHLHNKTIHFPIVLGMVAFVLSLFNRKNPIYDKIIAGIVLSASAFSILALITGLSQAHSFVGSEQEWLVNYHKIAGIGLMALYLLWVLFLKVGSLKKYSWIIGLLTTLVILITGFMGGVIAH